MPDKTCSKCKLVLPINMFWKNKRCSDGLQDWCKSCLKEYWQSPKGKAEHMKACTKYRKTPEGLASRKKYEKSEKGRIVRKKIEKKFNQSEKRIQIRKRYIERHPEQIIDRRQDPKYMEWIMGVYKDGNYLCAVCKKDNTLRAHHIMSWADNEHLRYVPANGICLCEDCHVDFHNQYGYGKNTEIQLTEWLVNKLYGD